MPSLKARVHSVLLGSLYQVLSRWFPKGRVLGSYRESQGTIKFFKKAKQRDGKDDRTILHPILTGGRQRFLALLSGCTPRQDRDLEVLVQHESQDIRIPRRSGLGISFFQFPLMWAMVHTLLDYDI